MYQFEMIVGQAVPFIVSFIYANSPVILGPKIPVELSSSRVPTLPVPYWMLPPTTPSAEALRLLGTSKPCWHQTWLARWSWPGSTVDGIVLFRYYRPILWGVCHGAFQECCVEFFCRGEAREQLYR